MVVCIKGSVFDMAGVLMLAFSGAVVLLFMAYMLVNFESTAATIPIIAGNAPAMEVLDQGNTTMREMDGLFAFSIFMVCMVTVIAAFLVPSHPVLFIIFFFLTMILIPVSAMLANGYEQISNTAPLNTVSVNYPITLLVFEWLPKITIIMSGLIAVAMWAAGGSKGGALY